MATQDELDRLRKELADELEPYFRSGNSIPVERAVIKAELGRRLVNALRAKPGEEDGSTSQGTDVAGDLR